MATKVVMEALSPTMEEGRLVEWKKQEGEPVAVGDVLAEVETDKAVMELVARAEGTLLKQIVGAGATVPVSEPIAVIGQPGEEGGEAGQREGGELGKRGGGDGRGADAARQRREEGRPPRGDAQATQPAPDRDKPTSMPEAPPETAVTETDDDRPAPSPAARPKPPGPAPVTRGRVRASPLARRIAADRGLDLAAVEGSGPEGRIIARDLEQARASAPAPAAAAPLPRVPAGEPYADVPLTQIRKTIAKRLSQSLGPIPTFYLTSEVDMERLWEAREALVAEGQRGGGSGEQNVKVSYNDIIIKAVALALRQHPSCNAWWQDDHIRYWNQVHLGMAVAIEDGLITPVIRDADLKSIREIASQAKDLAGRARERRLKPEEYTGATFTVSNLGMLDIDDFTAVINPPEAGILAVGRIVQKPVAEDGTMELRRRMRVTMSCDHRVIDGATGAQFLQTLKRMLENPLALVW